MKKIVIALALTACSAAALADPLPAFVMSCSGRNGGATPATVKWDRNTLQLQLEKGSSVSWAGPDTFVSLMRDEPRRNGQGRETTHKLGFRAKDIPVHAGTPRATTEQNYLTLYVLKEGPDTEAFLMQATIIGGVLSETKNTHFRDCTTTLDL